MTHSLSGHVAGKITVIIAGMVEVAIKEMEMDDEDGAFLREQMQECIKLVLPSFIDRYGKHLQRDPNALEFWVPFTGFSRDLLLLMFDSDFDELPGAGSLQTTL